MSMFNVSQERCLRFQSLTTSDYILIYFQSRQHVEYLCHVTSITQNTCYVLEVSFWKTWLPTDVNVKRGQRLD